MPPTYDVIVVGGGHNGLVHAAYLGRANLRVLVLERRDIVGGAAVTEEIVPGFKFSVASYVVSLLRPEIIRELNLRRHGLEILPLDGTFTPLPGGDSLWRRDDPEHTRREIGRFSRRDADAYFEFEGAMARMSRFVRPLLGTAPPDVHAPGWSGLGRLGRLVWRFRNLPPADRDLFMRLMTISAGDFVEDWFETDVLRATLSASGIIGTFLGVRSPGTAYVLLHHYMGEIDGADRAWGLPRGGMGSVSNAIAAAALEAGVEIRTGTAAAAVRSGGGRATGVVLDNGDEIPCRAVSSSLDPRQTFLRMVGRDALPPDFAAAIGRYRFRGCSAKVNLALDGLPAFGGPLPGTAHLAGAVSISPGMDYMERAYDDARRGRFSERPYMDIVIPTLLDDSLAPPGKHVMSCFVQYAPYRLRDGEWDRRRDALGDCVIDTLAEYAPDLPDRIVGRQVLTPLDIERTFGLTEGNIFQGELSLEQLFFNRPVPGWAGYRTPVRGLYLCGSGAHPGGGVMGAPGRNAARTVIADLSRPNARRAG